MAGEVMAEEVMAEEGMVEEVMVGEVMAEEVMAKEVMAEEVMAEEVMVKEGVKSWKGMKVTMKMGGMMMVMVVVVEEGHYYPFTMICKVYEKFCRFKLFSSRTVFNTILLVTWVTPQDTKHYGYVQVEN